MQREEDLFNAWVYGLSLIVLFTVSTLYHCSCFTDKKFVTLHPFCLVPCSSDRANLRFKWSFYENVEVIKCSINHSWLCLQCNLSCSPRSILWKSRHLLSFRTLIEYLRIGDHATIYLFIAGTLWVLVSTCINTITATHPH